MNIGNILQEYGSTNCMTRMLEVFCAPIINNIVLSRHYCCSPNYSVAPTSDIVKVS